MFSSLWSYLTSLFPSSSSASSTVRVSPSINIIAASQTGTALTYAATLQSTLTPLFPHTKTTQTINDDADIHIFILATTGDGETPDTFKATFQQIQENKEIQAQELTYAIFGLGNSTYNKFNACAKNVDGMLQKKGSTRIGEVGLGDDNGVMEDDYENWEIQLLQQLHEYLGLPYMYQPKVFKHKYEFTTMPASPDIVVYTGEIGAIGSRGLKRTTYTLQQPYYAAASPVTELIQKQIDQHRSTLQVEYKLSDSGLKYQHGDHIAVHPTNPTHIVDQLLERLAIHPDNIITAKAYDPVAAKKSPFPCPTTYKTAFLHYLDICAPCRSSFLKQLFEISSVQGMEGSTILDILRKDTSLIVDSHKLLELLPRLKPRYYSICSSPRTHAEQVQFAAQIVRGDTYHGVCTYYFTQDSPITPVSIRRTAFKLPRTSRPCILIASGTGVAPYRSFLLERQWTLKNRKKFPDLKFHMFFGLRRIEQDYLYREEFERFVDEGILQGLTIAESRGSGPKMYVQDALWESRSWVWEWLEEGAAIYVCGDAAGMSKGVMQTIMKIIQESGKSTEETQAYVEQMRVENRYMEDVW